MFSTDFYWNCFIKINLKNRDRDTDRDTETLSLHTPFELLKCFVCGKSYMKITYMSYISTVTLEAASKAL